MVGEENLLTITNKITRSLNRVLEGGISNFISDILLHSFDIYLTYVVHVIMIFISMFIAILLQLLWVG